MKTKIARPKKTKKKIGETPKKKKAGKVKKIAPKEVAEKPEAKPELLPEAEPALKPEKYYEAVGRRKTSTARVRLYTRGEKEFLINNKPHQQYFPTLELQQVSIDSLNRMKCLERFRVSVKVRGGGIHSQAEAVRHATARALILFNPDFRKRLKRAGFLTRDPRMRERKKFGLKRARKAPQWAKR